MIRFGLIDLNDDDVPELPKVQVGEYQYGNVGVTLEAAVRAVADVRAGLSDGVMSYRAVARLEGGETAPVTLTIP